MNITQSIQYIYHTLEFWKDFIVEDNSDWKWPYIEWYNKKITQPTQAELKKAWKQILAIQKAEQLKVQKKIEIDKLATLSDQLNLLATNLNLVTDELIKTSPALATNPSVVQGKKVLTWIKTILAK